MHSPQRHNVPFQKSPNRPAQQYSSNKRKSPNLQSLTLEEYIALKKSKPLPTTSTSTIKLKSPLRNSFSPKRNNNIHNQSRNTTVSNRFKQTRIDTPATVRLKKQIAQKKKTLNKEDIAPRYLANNPYSKYTCLVNFILLFRRAKDESIKEQVPHNNRITTNHIKEFIHWHQIQIQGNQAYINDSKALIEKLTTNLNQQEYYKYQQELIELLNRKMYYITTLRNRIEDELEEEKEQ
jgi:hypothetical protein